MDWYISSYLATGHVSTTTVVTKVMYNWIISVQFPPLCFLVLPERYFLYFIKGLKRSDHWRDEDDCLTPRPVPQAIEQVTNKCLELYRHEPCTRDKEHCPDVVPKSPLSKSSIKIKVNEQTISILPKWARQLKCQLSLAVAKCLIVGNARIGQISLTAANLNAWRPSQQQLLLSNSLHSLTSFPERYLSFSSKYCYQQNYKYTRRSVLDFFIGRWQTCTKGVCISNC